MPATDQRKTKAQLIEEIHSLRAQIADAKPRGPASTAPPVDHGRMEELQEEVKRLRAQLADQRSSATIMNFQKPSQHEGAGEDRPASGRSRLTAILAVICAVLLLVVVWLRFGEVRTLERQMEESLAAATEAKDLAQRLNTLNAELRAHATPRLVERVPFNAGRISLDPPGIAVLERMLPELRKNPSAQIRLLGYADNAGLRSQTRQETPTNIDLSVARAASVAEWLAKTGGIAAERIEVAGQGTARPVASNATPSGRSENRRVDVYLVSPPAAK